METDVPNVYACIAAVSAEIATTGIAKTRKNQQQGYTFRGIDDVYNAIAPLIAKHKLVIIPRILSREMVERESKTGGSLHYVTVEAEFDFVSVTDGSKVTARSFGEAMDSADKATNKAMSAAYKYTAFQTFCIPTEGDNDADQHTPEVKAAKPQPPRNTASTAPARTSQQPPEPPKQRAEANGNGSDLLISDKQRGRFFAVAKEAKWEDAELKLWLKEVWGLDSSKQIPREKYDAICESVKVRAPLE
jgi:ERF superfamily protein